MTYAEILKQYWGYDGFRGIQENIIESIGNGHDTLGLMPTGGGKSITFQVPALAKEGLCLVITPLIALMKDQVDSLREKGIPAAFINTTVPAPEQFEILGLDRYIADNPHYGHRFKLNDKETYARILIRYCENTNE